MNEFSEDDGTRTAAGSWHPAPTEKEAFSAMDVTNHVIDCEEVVVAEPLHVE